MALRTPTQYAEDLKVRYACALTQLAGVDEFIKVPGVGDKPDRELSRQTLAEVVEPRYDELFKLVLSELRRSGFEQLVASGIVLTGGGASLKLGQHLVLPEDTPLCNVWLTLLHGMGIDLERHGDSSGIVKELQA